ncbi:MAG TPA: septum formation initiator family protein [Ktedonobacteraceae bacterium]|nr:septum formation initiator family protein [Ktedonobacteraceae bacterium]
MKAGAGVPHVTSAIGTGDSPRRARDRRSSFFSRTVIWVTGLICLALLLGSLVQAWSNSQLNQRVQQTQAQLQQVRQHHQYLVQQADRYRDPIVIESEARQQMGYVRPGEHPIVIIGAPNPVQPMQVDAGKSKQDTNYWRAWWNIFFGG